MSVTYVLLLGFLGFAIHSQAQTCSKPAAGENMALKDNFSGLSTFEDGAKVSFDCELGYTPGAGSTSITCTAGSWSPLTLKCQKRNCGPAEDVPNGNIDYSDGTEFGNKITVSCNTGHILVGRNTLYCGAQGWIGRMPNCEGVVCLPARPPLKDVIVTPIKKFYVYREVIQYSCPKDFTLAGTRSATCSEDETFTPAPPSCVKVECKDPDIKNANWVAGSRPPHKYKYTVSFDCIPGYTMTGASTLTCGLDSQWSPGLPTCKLTPTTQRPSTTKKTIVGTGSTDKPPGNDGNAKAIGLGVGLTLLCGIILTVCGCYFCGVPAIIKGRRRSRRSSPDTVLPKEEEVALA